jgi:hypothetical protein
VSRAFCGFSRAGWWATRHEHAATSLQKSECRSWLDR